MVPQLKLIKGLIKNVLLYQFIKRRPFIMSNLIVHHLRYSQSERIPWLCEELGIDYDLKCYDRAPILSPEEYCKLHPLCAAPVINDGDLTIAESGACAEYITYKYGNGKLIVRPGEDNWTDYLYWFRKS